MRQKLSKISSERGSLTVEASIIVPTIMITILVLIMGGILLYQKLLLHYAVSEATQQGAEIWVDSRKDISDGSWDNEKERDPLYYRITNDDLFSFNMDSFENPYVETIHNIGLDQYIDDAKKTIRSKNTSIQDRKIARIRLALYDYLGRTVIKPDHTDLKIEFKNNFFERKIKVKVVQKYKSPIGFTRKKSKYLEIGAEA